MKITIVYDNEVRKEGLRAGWGFSAFVKDEKYHRSCLIEARR